MVDFNNKIILITGSTSGIGKSCSFAFGKLGAKIALIGRDEDKLSKLKNELKQKGIESYFFLFDLSQHEKIPTLVDEIEDHFNDSVDVLINSAGMAVLGLVDNLPLSSVKDNFDLNFFAPVGLIMAVLPGMKEKGFGQIINLFSGVGKRGLPGGSSYSSSKFALNGFSESIRVELMSDNIDVMLFSPGLVNSNFAKNTIIHGNLKNTFTDGKLLDSDMVASKIVEAATHRKREVTLSIKTRLGVLANFFSPKLLDRHLSKKI